MNLFNGTIELINLGRYQYCGFAEVKSEKEFWKVIKKHIMSNEIDWIYDESKNEGEIFVGGFRQVGKFRRKI